MCCVWQLCLGKSVLYSSSVGLGEADDTQPELPEQSSADLPSAQLRQVVTESAMF